MISNLTVRSLTQEERKTTYKQYMKHDFPKNELRPLHMIESLVEKGDYYTYGIFENERFVAYAYFWEEKEKKILLCDYFAVIPELRNQGYGTAAMNGIWKICKEKRGIILEAESPERADTEIETETRIKRIQFYEKCGLCMSDVKILLFGVEYSMMYRNLSGDETDKEIISVMQSLYKRTLPRSIYKKVLKIL